MSHTPTDPRSQTGFLQRVYMLAVNEARDARARRDLPFGGLFGATERASAAAENPHDTAN